MVNECLNAFEKRLESVAQKIPGQPRQEIILSRLQFMLTKKLQELTNQSLQQYGINDTVWTALMMLYSNPDNYIFPSDLSHVIVSSRTNITRLADEMVEKGWISREGCETDRRKIILTLTKAGVELVETVMPKRWAMHQTLWQDFTDEEKNLMEVMQRKLLTTLSNFNVEEPSC
ncbi:MarR family transcriptional regulator [Sulfuriferula thiophila]|uniref:MarR family transcriptional regulator n=1 Tax=Sulfuriferula thiophila TaxID=1781211 RepID=UPI000F605394|nr:MarR family transcriptional regulator [Sulfuriferula thiophila]